MWLSAIGEKGKCCVVEEGSLKGKSAPGWASQRRNRPDFSLIAMMHWGRDRRLKSRLPEERRHFPLSQSNKRETSGAPESKSSRPREGVRGRSQISLYSAKKFGLATFPEQVVRRCTRSQILNHGYSLESGVYLEHFCVK